MQHEPKPTTWVGNARDEWRDLPADVQDELGADLLDAQYGEHPTGAKHLTGYGAGVIELRDDYQTDTYRGVILVRYPEAVYVLHAFMKKSSEGGKMPKKADNLIRERLKKAEELHEAYERDHKRKGGR